MPCGRTIVQMLTLVTHCIVCIDEQRNVGGGISVVRPVTQGTWVRTTQLMTANSIECLLNLRFDRTQLNRGKCDRQRFQKRKSIVPETNFFIYLQGSHKFVIIRFFSEPVGLSAQRPPPSFFALTFFLFFFIPQSFTFF
uniref:Secreted protein n=1 Tax=Cacopsylla melanoneura TaxID=428564 RepID=A0A8D8UQW5_9HEMI